jgi:hypothetical protein
MRLKIKFDLDNDEFQTGKLGREPSAILKVLRATADKIERQIESGEESGLVMDSNGNSIGKWSIK